MAVTGTFTDLGASSALYLRQNTVGHFDLTGTWVGTMRLKESRNAGKSYKRLGLIYSANIEGDLGPNPSARWYQWECTAYTSGTIAYALNSDVEIPGAFKYWAIPISGALTVGTSITPVAGTWYISEVQVTSPFQATGIGVLNAATVGTNKWVVALYDSSGRLVANSAVAGVTTAGTAAFQAVPFSGGTRLKPGQYFIAAQLDGTTDRFRAVATATYIHLATDSQAGTFGTVPPLITVPTTFTADKGIISYLY